MLAAKKNAWFVDFPSVKAAAKVMDVHEVEPFRNGKFLLRLNYEETTAKFEQPHHTLCVAGFGGTSAELEQSLPQYDGGNHVVNITSSECYRLLVVRANLIEMCPVLDNSGPRPPLYFIEFESVEYATRTLAYFRQSQSVNFSAKYAGRPDDERLREPRRLFPPSVKLATSKRRVSRSK